MAIKRVKRVGQMVSGSRVTGLQIKAALNAAASKQIEAAGCRVGSGVVTFKGRTAFAQWQERNNVTRKSSSSRSRYSSNYLTGPNAHLYRSFRINYPAFASEAIFTRPEADLIAAYTLHETGHILYSNINSGAVGRAVMSALGNGPSVYADCEAQLGFMVSQSKSKLMRVWNGIEDARIEHTVIRSGRAANAKNLFARLLDKLTVDIGPDFNPTQKGSAPFALAILCREALGNGNAYTAKLLDRIPEPKRSAYAAAMEAVKKLPLGYDHEAATWGAAALFVKAFGAIGLEPDDEEEATSPEPVEEDEDALTEPDPIDPEDVEDDMFDDNEDGSGYDENDRGNDGNDEDSIGDDDEPVDDGQQGNEPGGNEPDEDGDEEGESTDGEPADEPTTEPIDEPITVGGDGESEDDGPDDGEDVNDGNQSGGNGAGGSEEFENREDHGKTFDSEPDINDIFDKANRRCGADELSETMMNFERCDIGNLSNTRARIKNHM